MAMKDLDDILNDIDNVKVAPTEASIDRILSILAT